MPNFCCELAYEFNNQNKVSEQNKKCEPEEESDKKVFSHFDPPDSYMGLLVELKDRLLKTMLRKCRAIRRGEKIIF